MIGDILSDAKARQLEFGVNSVQNLPVQTAVKTGTSSDYHDAWAVGYNYRYVVGVWMGNLDRSPTEGVSGAGGPALALRSIFAELIRNEVTEGLRAPRISESVNAAQDAKREEKLHIVFPTPGLQVAIDPRVPITSQQLPFRMSGLKDGESIVWSVDGQVVGTTSKNELFWQLKAGEHVLRAVVKQAGGGQTQLPELRFLVK